MPYVTSIERLVYEEGYQEGHMEGLEDGLLKVIAPILEERLGAAGKKLLPKIRALHDIEALCVLLRVLLLVENLDAVKRRVIRRSGVPGKTRG